MMYLKNMILTLLSCSVMMGNAQRVEHSLNAQWLFRFSHQVDYADATVVELPHTWNAQDALSGKVDYKRGMGNYEKKIFVNPEWKGKRIFLRFGGANTIASVFINGKYKGEHRGGYSAFVFEITDDVEYGKDNALLIRVSNAEQLDVMPLVGDFNMYGGIYRGVSLVVTDETCISPLDYASPGVYLTQQKVSAAVAEVETLVKLSNKGDKKKISVRAEVNGGDEIVLKVARDIELNANADGEVRIPLTIKKPHLWNGRKDPFLYRVNVSLWENDKCIDRVVQPLGLRDFHVEPDKGFFLNGEHLQLRGVCRHQDRPEIGNALRVQHHEEDVKLMLEMGANAARLAHYQQAEEMYDLMDEKGIVTWAEIPFVGPGGYADKGFVNSLSFRENGRQQLVELICQNYNHPSICFWGVFNEIKERGDNPIEYVKELNALVRQKDATRLSTAASNQSGNLNYITDVIAWNRYDGWYGSTPKALAKFLDGMHKSHPEICIGISEYGAGASIYHQTDSLAHPKPKSYWHPENWQTYYHMENWKIINSRPFVWGSFVWNLFDFGAAHRREGDRPGINDKGLITFDRKVKKDAFYFYKANWNPEKMVHIAGKRLVRVDKAELDMMAFTNCEKLELLVNGKRMGVMAPDEYATVNWKAVPLQMGKNSIEVRALDNSRLSDAFVIERVP